jgi:2',3'-cyclic-nucleotide 2'-phosphodiesterase (5'-nucleotidase family)
MKSRRYFLAQGTLATTAMFALKPLTSIGSTISQLAGFNGNYGKLAFLHTANMNNSSDNKVIKYIQDIKNKNTNAILLNAGQGIQDETGSLIYDASINGSNDLSAITGDYKIITKGNTRTGIISARPGENNIIQKIKTLSTWLKKEKNCTIVVCLSQLGYKNKNTADDITLAKESTHLDIIVGGHAENFYMQPIVALNSNNAEVIIHSASGNSFDCGKIEIDFDWQGRKNQISFANHSSKNITPNRAISVA